MPRPSKPDAIPPIKADAVPNAGADPDEKVVILHGAVGPKYYQGTVVTVKDLGVDDDGNPNVDLKRLRDLGAIGSVGGTAAQELYTTLGPDAVNPLGEPIVNPAPNAAQVIVPPGETVPPTGTEAKAPW